MTASRRQFVALAGAAGLTALGSRSLATDRLPTEFGRIRLGVCLYDFRDLSRADDQAVYIGQLVDACRRVGVGLVEINAPNLEPPTRLPYAGIPRLWDTPLSGGQKAAFEKLTSQEVAEEREKQRRWRVEAPLDYFTGVGARFRAAGIEPFSYVMTFTPDMTEAEMEAVFRHAAALGVKVFSTNQTKLEMAPRLVPLAERYDMDLGFHNHTARDNPNEVASREGLERLFALSPRCKVNLDVGHYVASNQDVLAFIDDHFDRITHFHMKDRKRDLGPGTDWGQGDVPLAAILQAIRRHRSQAPAIVEYEYAGKGGGIVETGRGIEYLKSLLKEGP